MRTQSSHTIFNKILLNTLIASTTNMFVWFALTYWIYLETRSVLVTSILAGIYMVFNTISSVYFGGIVDHNRKKTVMVLSSVLSLIAYICGYILFTMGDAEIFSHKESVLLWVMSSALLIGTIFGNLRLIALSTLVTILVPEERRDKANGLVGIVNGLSFSLTAVLSGFAIAFIGMEYSILVAIVITIVALIHMSFVQLEETAKQVAENKERKLDIRGTIAAIVLVPGLVGLLIFNVFNNLLGGVFMSLLDAYGLSLVSVEAWGTLWGVLGLGFILGGVYVSRYGLGKRPLFTMLMANAAAWAAAMCFTIYPSVALLGAGILVWMFISPIVEAAEQTVMQKVVPVERQGRVFGFSQSIESAVTPLTAFFIGPITELFVIPFMTTGAGVALIGPWFGVGAERGMALVFTVAGAVGLLITIAAFSTVSYKKLSLAYDNKKEA